MLPLHPNTCIRDMSLKHWKRDQKILDFFIQQNPKWIIDDQGQLWTFWVHHWACRFIGDEPESWRYPWKHVGQVSCRGADRQFPNRSDCRASICSFALIVSSRHLPQISFFAPLSLFDCTLVSFSFLFGLGSNIEGVSKKRYFSDFCLISVLEVACVSESEFRARFI